MPMNTDYTKEELVELNRRLRVAVIRAGDLGRYYQNEIRKKEALVAAQESILANDRRLLEACAQKIIQLEEQLRAVDDHWPDCGPGS